MMRRRLIFFSFYFFAKIQFSKIRILVYVVFRLFLIALHLLFFATRLNIHNSRYRA